MGDQGIYQDLKSGFQTCSENQLPAKLAHYQFFIKNCIATGPGKRKSTALAS